MECVCMVCVRVCVWCVYGGVWSVWVYVGGAWVPGIAYAVRPASRLVITMRDPHMTRILKWADEQQPHKLGQRNASPPNTQTRTDPNFDFSHANYYFLFLEKTKPEKCYVVNAIESKA